MIRVVLSRDDYGMCNGFHLTGHAGYAESGEDIICAAVSILVTNTVNSIEKLTEDGLSYEVNEKNGDLKCALTGKISKESWLLIESMLLGLRSIEQSYGKKYIKVVDK